MRIGKITHSYLSASIGSSLATIDKNDYSASNKSLSMPENIKPTEYATAAEIETWNHGRFHITIIGNPKKIAAVVFGEDHENTEHHRTQIELIAKIRPQIVLYEPAAGLTYKPGQGEFLEDPERLFNTLDKQRRSKPSFNNLREAADRFGFTVQGCDLTVAELEEYLGVTLDSENYTPDHFQLNEQKGTPAREEKMAGTTRDSLAQSSRTVIAILGGNHATSKKFLEMLCAGMDDQIGYAIVNQELTGESIRQEQ